MITKIYKWYLWIFERENFFKLKAEGECKGCGYCCNNISILGLKIRCPYIKGNKCKINYKKPLSCINTPLIIDKDVSKDCGYKTLKTIQKK